MNPFDYGLLYPESMKNAWIIGQISNPQNAQKNFVRRIVEGTEGTALARPALEGGWESHRMVDDGDVVFPLLQENSGSLRKLGKKEMPKEIMRFQTPNEAAIFARNEYKRAAPEKFGYEEQQIKPYMGWVY